jgi:hypothetical protein
VLLGKRAKSGEKAVDPASAFSGVEQIGGKSQREEGGQRRGPHGGKVAETTGEAAMPNRRGWMEIAAEMPVFQAEVGRDQDFVPRGRAKNGAIVANTKGDRVVAGGPCGKRTADLLNQSEFADGFVSLAGHLEENSVRANLGGKVQKVTQVQIFAASDVIPG